MPVKDKFYELSDVTSVAGLTAESLIPTLPSNASTIISLLRPYGTPPRALSLKDNKFLLSATGKELGCDAIQKVVSKFVEEEYTHIRGIQKKRVQLLVDCGHTPENKRPAKPPQQMTNLLTNANMNNISSFSLKNSSSKVYYDQYWAFSDSAYMTTLLPYIVRIVNRKPASKLAEYTSRKFMLLSTYDCLTVLYYYS